MVGAEEVGRAVFCVGSWVLVSIIITGLSSVFEIVTADVITFGLESGGGEDVTASGVGVDAGGVVGSVVGGVVGGVVGSLVGSVVGSPVGSSEVVGGGGGGGDGVGVVGVSEGVSGCSVVGVTLGCGEEVGGSGSGEEDGTVVGSVSAVLRGGRSEADGDGELGTVGEGPASLVEFADMVKRR